MHRFKRYRPSPAMIVAIVALVLSLGGTSYAAIVLPAGSVGTKQLKKSAVTSAKIKAGAVTGAKVKDRSLTGADILASSLGKVPSATNADSAAHANNADSAANATTVGGYAASSLARISIASGFASVPSGTAKTTVAVVSLTAPSAGFVLVQGWVDTAGGARQYYVRVWDDSAGDTAHSPWYNGDYAATGESSCGNTAVFPVTAGARNFSVRIEDSSAALSAWGTVTAQFIPFGATGSPTVLGSSRKGVAQPHHN